MRSTFILLSFVFVPACMIVGAPSAEAEVSVNAGVERTQVSEGESIEFWIEIAGNARTMPNIDLPNLAGFRIFSSGTSQNFSFVNGQVSQSKKYNFTLLPSVTGRLTIPPMTLNIDGKDYTTEAITITVTAAVASPGSNAPSNRGRTQRSGRQRQGISSDDLFITTDVDKDTAYVNEQVTLSFQFYQGDVDLLQNPDYRPPQKTGFWVEDLPPQRRGYRTVNGRNYAVTEISTGLFPTAPGEQTIGSAELEVVVNDRRSDDPFSLFGGNWPSVFGQGQAKTLKSDPIKIMVLPLPTAGKPDNFSGAVGSFRMESKVDKTKVEVNEPVTLSITISGIGNIKTIATPKIQELPDFRTYQSGEKENITRDNYRVGGTKTFEQAYVPKKAGSYLLPAIDYSYFDPQLRTYKTISAQAIQIEVAPSKGGYASQMQQIDANRIDLVAKDIRYLKSDIGDLKKGDSRPLAESPLILLLYLLPAAGYLVLVGRQRHQEKLRTDTGFRRLRQARKMAESRLSKARHLLSGDDPDAFYSETNQSVLEYFADRFNLPTFGLTADKIKEFADGKLDEAMTTRLLSLLQQCDFGRFAPGGRDKQQMQRLWDEASNLIVDLEKTR